MPHGFKKIIFSLTTLSLVTASLVGIFSPAPAQAQIPVTVTSDIPKAAEKITDIILEGIKTASINATVRMVGYAIRKVSYDSAVWLASGGKGQTPFAHTKNFGEYMKDVGNQAGGAFIEELGRGIGGLCKIPDIKVDLAVKIGLRTNFTGGAYGPQGKPNCTLTDFKKNWFSGDNWKSKYGADQIGKRFNATLTTDNSGLGIYGQLTEKINNKIITEKTDAQLERQEGQGFKGKETVGGRVQTPPALVQEEFKALTPDKQRAKDQEQLNATLASGNVKVIPAALSLFLNTLVGTMVKNWQENGMLPFGACVGGAGGASCDQGVAGDISNAYYGLNGGGAAYAQSFFSYIKTVKIDELASYDILSELANCPDTPGTYNCRADDDLILALRQADTNQPVTIAEAMERGWLHGDWKFVPPSDENGSNSDKECFQKAYCYGNAQVLRQLRIMPLGFEIAAKNSSQDKPWTLADVVNGFNNCSSDVNDPTKPFCHLIDPNWVLRAPPAKCNAYVYGSNLLTSGVPDRLQECVDLQSCVSYDANGRCNDFAYCTREKNTWNFDAQKCEQQYATCRSFTNANGQNVAYLQRTLDTQSCTPENVGCRGYSLTQKDGAWLAPGINDDGTNKGIFFNSKVSTSCSANSAGCSAFKVANSANDMLFLKKAPDYLKCYDAKPDSDVVDWPATQSDLTNIKPAAECSNYSGACVADEVNCNFYTAKSGSSKQIPGRFTPAVVANSQVTWNDQCDAKCVGYAAFREMQSNYSNGQSVANIIPSSGQKCTAQEEGCSAFTNLSGTGETIEHYSYLRPCAKPAPGVVSKTYVTYEGAVQGGYQLKTYTLVVNQETENGPIGAPKYFSKTAQELIQQNLDCTEAMYKSGVAPLDCRQFNDEAGNIYYRLLSYTIPVTEACTAYRLDSAELATDGTCFQSGKPPENGSCFYEGLPGTISNNAGNSRSCSAVADTCRGYKGNAGNNIEVVFDDNFENVSAATITGWSGGVISAESTRVGEHSFANVSTNKIVRTINTQNSESYDLSFWAKGSNSAIVKFGEGSGMVDVGVINLSDTWNYYHLGPFEFSGATNAAELQFVNRENAGRVFLDNVRLVRVRDLQYLVKKSLSVDPVCDSNQNDNLPGEALGCDAYTDPTNRTFNLTGFSYLCRENAIGCTAVTQTYNTPDDTGARAYNVRLSGAGGSTPQVRIGTATYSCVIPVGETSCYVNMTGHSANEIRSSTPDSFIASTIYVPPDSPASAPIYLVANQAGSCNQVDLGCTVAGAQQLTPGGLKFVTTTIKNDPASYDTALCRSEAVGCNAYSDGSDTQYFKDPAITGQKVCTYRTNVRFNGLDRSGWFWKGVGKCSNTSDFAPGYCTADSECGSGQQCINLGDQPCYPNYQNSGEYGLWSAGNTATYQNFVGECPVSQNKCSEFRDPNDNNRAYYFIKDSRISEGDCSGQVSQKFGCALFNETSNPNKFFNSKLLYAESEAKQGNKVAATQSNQAGNDSNLIIKVGLDRVCGEWLGCQNRSVFDENTGKYKDVCYNVSLCNGETCSNVKSDYSNNILSESLYRSRQVGWSGKEYSGYSILGLYPLNEIEDHNFASSAEPDYRLVYKVGSSDCEVENQRCGTNSQPGICKNRACVKTIRGELEATDIVRSEQQICRGYPEKDAPFPFTSFIKRNADYSLANKCAEYSSPTSTAQKNACECDYTKVSYGDAIVKYWKLERPNQAEGMDSAINGPTTIENYKGVPLGICVGGKNGVKGIEKACDQDVDCPDGTCQQKSGDAELIGYRGYCVEEDTRSIKHDDPTQHNCLTWFPGRTNGLADLFNQFTTAGFNLSEHGDYGSGAYYCAEAEKWQRSVGTRESVTFNYDCNGAVDDTFGGQKESSFIGQSFSNIVAILRDQPIRGKHGDTESTCEKGYDGPGFPSTEDHTSEGARYITTISDYNPCPRGTRPGVITSASTNNKDYVQTVGDREDQITLGYTCESETQSYWVPAHAFVKQYATEATEIEYRCKVMYETGTKPSEVVAATQNWFRPAPLENPWKDTACSPAGAVSLNQIFSTVAPNAVVVMKNIYEGAVGTNGPYYRDCAVGKRDTPAQNITRFFGEANYKNYLATLKQLFARAKRVELLDSSPPGKVVVGATPTCNVTEANATWNEIGTYFATGKDGQACASRDECVRNDVGSNTVSPCNPNYIDSLPESDRAAANSACSKVCSLKTADTPAVIEKYEYRGTGWEPKDVISGDPKAPKVRSVSTCRFIKGKEVCVEGEEGITLVTNEASFNNTAVRLSADNSVTMRFFAFGDNNHMPIKRLAIDWGDGTEIGKGDNFDSGKSNLSSYRNQRGGKQGTCETVSSDDREPKKCVLRDVFYESSGGVVTTNQECRVNSDCNIVEICEAESASSPFFGILRDRTCNTGYFEFKDHNYQCVKDSNNPFYRAECPVDKQEFPDGCCVYKPKVHVKDNWGWCTGTETCDSSTGKGCYDNGKPAANILNKCDINSAENGKNAWVQYTDAVYVSPLNE